MPFLPPNQQRQSTEGTCIVHNNQLICVCAYECIMNLQLIRAFGILGQFAVVLKHERDVVLWRTTSHITNSTATTRSTSATCTRHSSTAHTAACQWTDHRVGTVAAQWWLALQQCDVSILTTVSAVHSTVEITNAQMKIHISCFGCDSSVQLASTTPISLFLDPQHPMVEATTGAAAHTLDEEHSWWPVFTGSWDTWGYATTVLHATVGLDPSNRLGRRHYVFWSIWGVTN